MHVNLHWVHCIKPLDAAHMEIKIILIIYLKMHNHKTHIKWIQCNAPRSYKNFHIPPDDKIDSNPLN